MKVLIINDTYNKVGGVKTVIDNQIKILKKNKIEVKLFSFANKEIKDKNKYIIKENHNKLIRYLFGVFFYPMAYLKLTRYIKRTKPDMIHLHNIDRYPLTILLACKTANCKIIRTVHDYGIICPTMWCVKKNNLQVCEGGLGIKCLKNCISFPKYLVYNILFLKNKLQKKIINVFITPSKTLKTYLENHSFKNVIHCRLGIDIPNIKNRKKGKNLLLYVGELSVQKGPHLIIKTMPLISKSMPNIKLKIIGHGSEKENLIKLARELGQEKRIFFAEGLNRSSLYEEYAKSNVLVMPSIWLEQFGLVGIESICCGTPVLATKRGGITEWLKEGENGYFFRNIDYKTIAEDIISFLKRGINQKRFKESQKEIISKFSIEEYEKNTLKIYENVG